MEKTQYAIYHEARQAAISALNTAALAAIEVCKEIRASTPYARDSIREWERRSVEADAMMGKLQTIPE